MPAVAATPFFAERIAVNPSNRQRLLAMDAEDFVRVMYRWNTFFYHRPDRPVIGATEEQLRGITAPTLVFQGNDDIHTQDASDALHRLIAGSELAPLPSTHDEWMEIYTGTRPGSVMEQLYPRLAGRIGEFLDRTEAQSPR